MIAQAALREFAAHDLGLLKEPLARGSRAAAATLLQSSSERRRAAGFRMLMKLHRGAFSPSVDDRILKVLRNAIQAERGGTGTGLSLVFQQVIENAAATLRTSDKPDPLKLLGSHALVVKSASSRERGVLVVDYSNNFSLLPACFDLQAIAERYTIVLEPSWAGCCTPEILLYTSLSTPVFVQTVEPRDEKFLTGLHANLRVVPVAANWWVKAGRLPATGANRDIDVAIIAAWADIKRHWRVFRALADLRKRGHRLKVVLIGYRYDRTKSDIEALARFYGIQDQVEAYEYIPQEEVSAFLNRSKVHVLWSRRECANRAIVEAMLCDVPVIVREGLTFGFRYPYINDATGRFVPEADLGQAILDMIAARDNYSPRNWVLQNMTYERANAVLEEHLKDAAIQARRAVDVGVLAPKTSGLYRQIYVNADDAARFDSDYRFLKSVLRLTRP